MATVKKSQKKTTVKKAMVKKGAAKKKAVSTKSAAASKKAAAKKRTSSKKKVATRKSAAPKKKSTTRPKAVVTRSARTTGTPGKEKAPTAPGGIDLPHEQWPVDQKAPGIIEVPGTNGHGKVNNVSVRMYCHGFGDCFLLTFFSDKTPVYKMLIDCGMLTGDTSTLKQAIAHIKEDCKGKLNLVVQTHQHKDHISGFNLRDDKKQLLWDDIVVDKVWLAWTENTTKDGDDLAIQLKKKQEKKKKALAKALHLYNNSIQQAEHRAMLNNEYRGSDYYAAQQRYATALQQMLEFYDISATEVAAMGAQGSGELGLTMKDAMGYFINRSQQEDGPDINYWNPGDLADAKRTGLEGVNFYFLGPPKDYDKLRVMDDSSHAEMYLTEMGLSDNFFMALSDNAGEENTDALSPFHKRFAWNTGELSKEQKADRDNVWNIYNDKNNNWRSIETDWLHNAGALALNLDSYTNNTSLVIAIELEDSGKVLLFPADAQIGNWLSWTEVDDHGHPVLQWEVTKKGGKDTVTAAGLLERTVFYKVGHHASHNATAREHGLELMTSDELVAMIPVDEAVARKQGKKGWKMPADDLYKRLLEKTKSRIIRLDMGNLLTNGTNGLAEGTKPTKEQLAAFNQSISESDIIITSSEGVRRPLFFEYTING